MEYIKFKELGGTVTRGPRLSMQDQQSENAEKVRVLNWSNLKKLCEGKDLDDIQFSSIDLKRKQKKADMYVQEGDIVLPVFPRDGNIKPLYIRHKTEEKFVYSELVLVLRIPTKEIRDYIYLLLNYKVFFQKILEGTKVGTVIIRYRLTNEILENMEIPFPDENKREELIKKYSKMEQLEKQIMKIHEDLEDEISNLIK